MEKREQQRVKRVTATNPRFKPGDHVEVLDLGKAGHVRIPVYIRGKQGKVIQYCGKYLNPEDLSVGQSSGPAVDLYRIEFSLSSLWDSPVQPAQDLPVQDLLVIEIYDHWLAAVEL